ncbi:DUF2281 domain-containing protein [Hydrogenovibrio halophilus]|uniref:DUF2281 domain-containing protein n=1 Tax=Hydrogenovibrio halophilus TaxID=373391 RepID=UPI00035E8843|nr:DUF2281 domain-containing protein [Hydrogenovibrio halophilus]
MQLNELVEKINRLPDLKRQEVADFVAFLETRYANDATKDSSPAAWHDQPFKSMSIDQAMVGLDDEPDLYTEADLKAHWS